RVLALELARERGFGHAGHADQIAAVATKARNLRARFKPRALGRAVAAAIDDGDARGSCGRDQRSTQGRRVRLAEIDVLDLGGLGIAKARQSTAGVVDELI